MNQSHFLGRSALMIRALCLKQSLHMSSSTEILNTSQCLDLLRQVPVGRVGISIDALPVILPVHYAVVGEGIVFRTNPGTKLAAATNGAVVAFEVDSYAEDGKTGWSVMVQGVASEVSDIGLYEDFLGAPAGAWALGGRADHLVRIEAQKVSGRRFVTDHDDSQRAPSQENAR